jgi:hypothetical protein
MKEQFDEHPGHAPPYPALYPPEVILGYLTLLLAEAFCLTSVIAMCRAVWFECAAIDSFIAFCGFGMPMAGFGAITAWLWSRVRDESLARKLELQLGWVCVFDGLLWVAGLFGLVAEWVKLVNYRSIPIGLGEGLCLSIGFAAMASICMSVGIIRVILPHGGEGSTDQDNGVDSHTTREPDTDQVARSEWFAARSEGRYVNVMGDAMAPVVVDGTCVAYSADEESPEQLHNKLVVAWIEGQVMVRWFQRCGRYALLRAENPDTNPQQSPLIDLEEAEEPARFRRVIWINPPL